MNFWPYKSSQDDEQVSAAHVIIRESTDYNRRSVTSNSRL